MTRIYVVDTSYLLELFEVPTFSTPKAVEAVRLKFQSAFTNTHQIIVPLGCVFELGDHIADVEDVGKRRELARKLAKAISSSLATSQPWQITPPDKLDSTLAEVFEKYAEQYLPQGMGLTDTYTLEEARRLKNKYVSFKDYLVHIWTKDRTLKAHEPDSEPDPFTN